MQLTQSEKIAIYASALEGVLSNPNLTSSNADPYKQAIHHADELIKELEERDSPNPLDPIED